MTSSRQKSNWYVTTTSWILSGSGCFELLKKCLEDDPQNIEKKLFSLSQDSKTEIEAISKFYVQTREEFM